MPIETSATSGEPGTPVGSRGFSWKPVTLSFSSTATTPKRVGLLEGHLEQASVAAAPRSLVEAQHAGVVHLVDVIAREHDDVLRVLARDRVEVLVDGVGGAEIPVLADTLLRRQDLDEFAELLGEHFHPMRMWRLSDSDLYCVQM